jgi:hypothetical protein
MTPKPEAGVRLPGVYLSHTCDNCHLITHQYLFNQGRYHKKIQRLERIVRRYQRLASYLLVAGLVGETIWFLWMCLGGAH